MEQEIQEAKSLYYSYKQYFSDYLPALTKLGLKVVMALLVFVGGRKVIQWFVSFIKKSMERASVDKGVIQFTGSLLRIVLYILLVFSIATHFGVKESSIAWYCRCNGRSCIAGRPCKYRRRDHASDLQTISGGGLYHYRTAEWVRRNCIQNRNLLYNSDFHR